jgi:hypothetical protein
MICRLLDGRIQGLYTHNTKLTQLSRRENFIRYPAIFNASAWDCQKRLMRVSSHLPKQVKQLQSKSILTREPRLAFVHLQLLTYHMGPSHDTCIYSKDLADSSIIDIYI